VSGPNTATFNSKTVAAPTVSSLVQGSYVFSLVVTDNQGSSSAADQVVVTVSQGIISQAVTSFTLINADTDQEIQTLTNGATLNLTTLPSKKLNIRANTSPATVGSVAFNLTGQQTRNEIDSRVPFALFGDNNGRYRSWTPVVGSYTLKGTPYSGTNGTGPGGSSLTLSFNVVNQPVTATSNQIEEVQRLDTSTSKLQVVAYPNPSKNGHYKVMFYKPLRGDLSYTLMASSGATITQGNRILHQPTSVLDFNFSGQTTVGGVYYLKLEYKHQNVFIRLLRTGF
jgi:hypothetical protein